MDYYFEKDILGSIGTQKYLCNITWRNGTIVMDEPENIQGKDLGPDPYTTLLASLAGCTLSTLRMYIDRKEWNITEIQVSLNFTITTEGEFSTDIKREIRFSNEVSDDQKQRLLLIAGKCPVSKILENKIKIHTSI
jgi:putative redox protein